MPPPDPRIQAPQPDRIGDRVQDAIKQLRSIDPSIDARPGTNVRTLIEAAARSTEMLPLPDYGPTLRPPERRITLSSLTDRERHDLAERHRYNAIRQMQAHEDQLIYAALDRAVRETPWPTGQELMGLWANPAPSPNPPNHTRNAGIDLAYSQEATGVARAGRSRETWAMMTERVLNPTIPLYSNPTINIDEVRERRFNVMARHSTNPCGEQTLGVTSEMTLEQMNKMALIVRKTAWERLLSVEELEFPV